MLGFGALGEFALGEGPNAVRRGSFTQFSSPIKKAALSVAVAGSFSGFLAPPPAKAARSFVAFSQPLQQKKTTQVSAVWGFVRPAAPAPGGIFSSFSQPQPVPGGSAHIALMSVSTSFVLGELPDITSRVILHDPIDYYMEGLPQFRGTGNTFEQMRGEAKTEQKVTTRKGGRLSKEASSFNVRTDKRGYD